MSVRTEEGKARSRPGGVFQDAFPQFLMMLGVALLVAVGLVVTRAAFTQPAAATPAAHAVNAATTGAAGNGTYRPRTDSFVMVITPLWVHEETGTFDYLQRDFSKKGLFNGKEAWGFYPSTITVYQGDTVDIQLYNPSSDPHTFTAPDLRLSVPVAAQAIADVHFTASKVGTFTFACMVEEHNPFMYGQLVVLPGADGPQS